MDVPYFNFNGRENTKNMQQIYKLAIEQNTAKQTFHKTFSVEAQMFDSSFNSHKFKISEDSRRPGLKSVHMPESICNYRFSQQLYTFNKLLCVVFFDFWSITILQIEHKFECVMQINQKVTGSISFNLKCWIKVRLEVIFLLDAQQ